MKITSTVFALTAAVALFSQAAAQTPAAPATTTSATIPGLCIFNQDELVGTSAVGKFAQTRLQQIVDAAASEVTAANTALEAERASLTALVQTNGEAAMAQQIAAFDQKAQALLTLRDQRAAEVERTSDLAYQRVMQEANPILQQIFTERSCAVLLDATATAGFNSAMDVTPRLVQLLDAKIQTFTLDRASLTQ